jgi:hypothetical protein
MTFTVGGLTTNSAQTCNGGLGDPGTLLRPTQGSTCHYGSVKGVTVTTGETDGAAFVITK